MLLILLCAIGVSGQPVQKDTCKLNSKWSCDAMNYYLYNQFISYPQRVIGNGNVPDLQNYKLNNFCILYPLDTLYQLAGKPECESTFQTEGENVGLIRKLYYDGILFSGIVYHDYEKFRITTIKTCRRDVSTPNGIHCGMTIDELKKIVQNMVVDCQKTGLIRIRREEGGPDLNLMFVDNVLEALILTIDD